MIAGTAGWILEKKSRNLLLKSGGEALRRAVRSCDIGAGIVALCDDRIRAP
jgi:hypothetical protein